MTDLVRISENSYRMGGFVLHRYAPQDQRWEVWEVIGNTIFARTETLEGAVREVEVVLAARARYASAREAERQRNLGLQV
jgi:hypothetical protein